MNPTRFDQPFDFTRILVLFLPLWIFAFLGSACTPSQTPVPTPAIETEQISPTPLPANTSTSTPAPSPTHTVTPLPPTETPLPQVGARSIGDSYAPELGNTGYDVQHYTLQLALDPAQTYVDGAATIEALATLHNLVELSLDFSGFDIEALTVDEQPATYTRDRGKFIITLPEPLAEGQAFTIFVDYAGAPIQTGSAFVPFVHHLGLQFLPGNIYAVNEPDGAHYWFPCNDHPRDKATFTFEITVPAGLEAISHGTLIEEETVGETTTFVWDHPYPMATYLATVVIGDYEVQETVSPLGVPIQNYYFSDLRDPFVQATSMTGEALDWMSAQFGAYPFESFGFVTTRLIRASLETQTMVILSENMLNEETVIHEIVHQWFGNWVSMASWADMWHNEGFAVYVSLMWQTRNNPGSLNIFMQNLEAEVQREASPDPLGNLAPQRLFGFDSYQRGALVVHKLRQTVGDEAFFAGLRLYFERFGGEAASREDFMSVMEEASGMDLDDFFEEWLN
ncbi:MAG: M1 family metallopeptidase [Anaerolineales bacterium]